MVDKPMTDYIIVDQEFKHLIPSLTSDEYKGLEEKLLNEGFDSESYGKIILWNNIIVDGHNRYEICRKHNIPFETTRMEFNSRDDVIDWMYSNQLDKRNLTDEKRTYLMGKQYEMRKERWGGDRKSEEAKSSRQNVDLTKTASKVAEEQKVSSRTVERAAEYARAVEDISQNVVGKKGIEKIDNEETSVGIESLKNKILSGQIKTSKKDVIELAKKTIEDQKEIIRTLEEGNQKDLKAAIKERELEKQIEESKQKSVPIQLEDDISLYNDDCFNILPQIKNGSVDMILADLPYGTTACAWDTVLPLDKLWDEYKRILKDNGVVVLTSSQPFTWKLCSSNPEWFKYEIIWEKPNGTNPLLVKRQPFKVHENVLVFYKKQGTYNPQMTQGKPYSGFSDNNKTIGEVFSGSTSDNRGLTSKHRENLDGSRYPRSVIRCKQDRSGQHPTKKPVELMSWLIKTYTNPGEFVLDNTMGEGTTGVACVIEKRKFIGIEINKKYYDAAVESINKEKDNG